MNRYFFATLLALAAAAAVPAHAQFSLPGIGKITLPGTKTTPTATTNTGIPSGLSSSEAASGLKQALEVGISKGADQASATDGFNLNQLIRIPFPPDAQRVATTLRKFGMGSQVDAFELSLNRGAEDAARSAKPIFIQAIKSLSFSDVWGILTGGKDAATQYLQRTTTTQLTAAFAPIMAQSLEKVSATRYYTSLTSTYNRLPLVTPVQTDLTQYATGKAVDGLFVLIAQQEADIRANPIARTTSLLKKVFGGK